MFRCGDHISAVLQLSGRHNARSTHEADLSSSSTESETLLRSSSYRLNFLEDGKFGIDFPPSLGL